MPNTIAISDPLFIRNTDVIDRNDLDHITAIIKTLNTSARIIPIANGKGGIDNNIEHDFTEFH